MKKNKTSHCGRSLTILTPSNFSFHKFVFVCTYIFLSCMFWVIKWPSAKCLIHKNVSYFKCYLEFHLLTDKRASEDAQVSVSWPRILWHQDCRGQGSSHRPEPQPAGWLFLLRKTLHPVHSCLQSQLSNTQYCMIWGSGFSSWKVSPCLGAEGRNTPRNQICFGLLLISDSWILVQRGTECDELVCQRLQRPGFILTFGAVDASEGSRVITCKHLNTHR